MQIATKWMITAALLASVIITFPSAAEEAGTDGSGISPYAVARLKVYDGSVWVRTPDSGDWEEYLHNSPVAERSRISVPEGSEAELQFHGGQFMLLSEGTEIDILEMGAGRTRFHLRYGDIKFYLPESDFSPVRLSVPEERHIEFPVPGQYWITAGDGGDSSLIVRSGEATVAAADGEYTVAAGEEASIGRNVQISKYAGDEGGGYEAPPPLTEEEKNAKIPPAAAYELREYGDWVESSEYGAVWRPRVAPGWTPYYYGRWVWVSPYGWTWVAYEPWGWYPYHYGYWYTDPAYGWVWYPYNAFVSFSFVYGGYSYPCYHGYASYYPARVRYVPTGGTVRWVPLNPGDRYGSVRYTRADKRLARWDNPLRGGTVYVRGEGSGGREWRDVNVVQREQQRNRVSRSVARREHGSVANRSSGPQNVGGIGRGGEPRSFEQGKVPSVRTETGGGRPDRNVRSRESRPGSTDRPSQPEPRFQTPARSRGRTSNAGNRGTYSQITRGEAGSETAGGGAVRTGDGNAPVRSGGAYGRSGSGERNAMKRPAGSDTGDYSGRKGPTVGSRAVTRGQPSAVGRSQSREGSGATARSGGHVSSRTGTRGQSPAVGRNRSRYTVSSGGGRGGGVGRPGGAGEAASAGGRIGGSSRGNVFSGTGGRSGGFGGGGFFGGSSGFVRGGAFGGGSPGRGPR